MTARSNDMVDDARALAVLAVPPGSHVLLLGPADETVAAGLAGRGCSVVRRDRPEGGTDGTDFDAVVLLDILETVADPLALLRGSTQCLRSEGRVVASVRNISHGAVRLQLLRGRFPSPDDAPRFDRVALQHLFRQAGLVVVDHLRVRRGLTETPVEVDPASFKPEILAALDEDVDAETYQLVFVGRAGGTVSPSLSLAEQLQERLDEAERVSRERADRVARLEEELAAGTARVAELATVEASVAELEEALAERTAELDSLHRQVEAARLDIELKDAFVLELRAVAQGAEEEAHRTRIELQGLQRVVAHQKEAAAAAAGELELSLAEAARLRASTQAAESEAERSRLQVQDIERELVGARETEAALEKARSELETVTARAGYRMLERVNALLEPLGPLAPLARGTIRWIARRAAPPR